MSLKKEHALIALCRRCSCDWRLWWNASSNLNFHFKFSVRG